MKTAVITMGEFIAAITDVGLKPCGAFKTVHDEVDYLEIEAARFGVPTKQIRGTREGNCEVQKANQANKLRDLIKKYAGVS